MSSKCIVCDKTVYPMEVQPGVKFSLHKACFRCATCKRTLTVSGHVVHGKTLLCQKDSQSLSQEAQLEMLNKDKLIEQRKREKEEEALRKVKEKEEAEERRIAREKRIAEEKERRLKELISKLTDEDEKIVDEKVNLFQNDEKNGWDLSPTRFIATISLTKSIYSTGETIEVTSHLFNVHSLLPFNFSFITYQTTPTFSILNSDRAVVAQFYGSWNNYSIVGSQALYNIPAGDYRLQLEIPFQQKNFLEFGRAEREFSIQSHSSPPRFRKELEFVKKGYAAGDEVSAKLNVTRAEGGAPSDAKVIASVQISGNEISSHSLTLEEDGSSLLTFSLPDQLPDDVSALLHISVDDGSITESISKTIPILQNNLIVKFYPEGGNLIAGLENIVYVDCNTKSQEPADIEAVIIEINSNSKREYPVSRFATIHEGRAKFSFNPKVNFTYRCDVIKPANVGSLSLPDILSSGVVLHSPHNIFEEEIGVWVGSTNACKLLVQLFKKEVLISQETLSFSEKDILDPSIINSEERPKVSEFYGTKSRKIVQQQENLSRFGGGSQDLSYYEEEDLPSSSAPINNYDEDEDEDEDNDKDENEALSKPGFKYVSLPLIESANLAYNETGVFRVLVTDKDLHLPYAERLVYRKIKEVLNVEVVTDKAQYSTSDSPVIAVKVTRSSDGSAVGGARMDVVVVDDSSLQMQEKRLQHPTIAPMVYLENEVKELKDTELYLPEYSSKATREAVEENLDLLLGIQGWRRFIFTFKTKNDCKEWFEKYPANSSSLLAITFLQQQAIIEPQTNYYEYNYNMPPPPPSGGLSYRARSGRSPGYGGRGGGAPPSVDGHDYQYELKNEYEENEEPKMSRKSSRMSNSSKSSSFSFQKSLKIEAKAPISLPCKGGGGGGLSISRTYSGRCLYPRSRIPVHPSYNRAADTISKSIITTDQRGVAVINCSQPSTSSQYRILLNSFHPFLPLFGSSTNHFVSVKEDFYLQMNLPKIFTRKDQILLPIGVVNNSENDIEKVDLQIENMKGYYINVKESFQFNHEPFPLSSNTRVRKYVPFEVIHPFKQILSINAKTDLHNADNESFVSHSIERPINVVDSRFVMRIENSGVVEKRIKFEFEVPEDISGEEQSILYSKLFILLPTSKYAYKFDQLISRPAGCVEQITSTLYIVSLSYQYLSKQPLTPSIFKSLQKATEYLNEGYTKLTQMECKNGGFDWWGSTTPHLGLSAYAIFVLKEMAKCIPNVQSSFIQRSVDWILSQRTEGLGRLMFNNDRYSYLYGQASKETIEAFVLFALTSFGVSFDLIKPELDFLFRYNGTDTYIWCLIAMIKNNIDKKEEAIATAKIIASKLNQKEGYVAGGSTSITSSFGINLVLETTAFAVWGWIEIDKEFFAKEIKSASEYLFKNEHKASTQASALIMKINSLLDTTEVIRHPFEPFAIIHNNKPLFVLENEKDYFNAFESDRLTFDFAKILHVGRHSIEIHNVFGSSAQYSFITSYTTTVPQTHPDTPLSLKLFLINGDNNEDDYNNNDQQQQIKVGENVPIKVIIKNNSENVMGMITTEIGLPAGLLPNYSQLRQFVKAKKVHFYEIRDNILVFYWRSFSANEEKSFILNFSSILPGDFLSVASCVYPYYATEYIYWHTPLKVSIQTSD